MRQSRPMMLLPSLAALLLVAACASHRVRFGDLASLYEEQFVAPGTSGSVEDFDRNSGLEAARRDRVHQLMEQGRVVTPQDRFFAAAILNTSDELSEIELAREMALSSAEDGFLRALPLAAESIDHALLKRGLPQKYGTQIVWEPVVGRWSLWDLDPRVTDAERRSMGIPPLEETRASLAELNRPDALEAMRGR